MSHSTGTDRRLNPKYPTDTVYWYAPDGSWGVCQRGDLVIINRDDITPRDLADIIDARTDIDRATAMGIAEAKTILQITTQPLSLFETKTHNQRSENNGYHD